MTKLTKKELDEKKRKAKRKRMHGTAEKPRLCVFRSNVHTYAQLIDDDRGITLVTASSLQMKLHGKGVELAGNVGKRLASAAMEKGIRQAVFDRNGFKYHGRVKALAEAARAAGLKV